MATSILSLLAVLIPFIIWLIRRRMAANDDPYTVKEKEDSGFAQAVAKGDETSVNVSLDDTLKWLQDHDGDTGGQSSSKN